MFFVDDEDEIDFLLYVVVVSVIKEIIILFIVCSFIAFCANSGGNRFASANFLDCVIVVVNLIIMIIFSVCVNMMFIFICFMFVMILYVYIFIVAIFSAFVVVREFVVASRAFLYFINFVYLIRLFSVYVFVNVFLKFVVKNDLLFVLLFVNCRAKYARSVMKTFYGNSVFTFMVMKCVYSVCVGVIEVCVV